MQSELSAGYELTSNQTNASSALEPQRANGNGNGRLRRAAGLGWFSIGLGLTQLVAPRSLGRLIGAGDDPKLRLAMRALGLRELASGIGILTGKEPGPWLWARVAGDLMDLALLGTSATRTRSEPKRLLAATAAVVGVGLMDGLAAMERTRRQEETDGAEPEPERTLAISKSITINRPPEEVYRFWRNLANLPRFMAHLESVEMLGTLRSRWRAKAPLGVNVEWDAEIQEDEQNECLRWKSLPGSGFENEGAVTFRQAPGGRGTELHLELRYQPPLGIAGFSLAKLFGAVPKIQIENDLRRLKQIVETGDVVHSDASIHRGAHSARPASESENTKSEVQP